MPLDSRSRWKNFAVGVELEAIFALTESENFAAAIGEAIVLAN
jgi:hypothetical protein